MGKLSQNPLQTVVLGVVLNFDELYLQAQMDFFTKLKFCHQLVQLLSMNCPKLDFEPNRMNPVNFGPKTKDYPPPQSDSQVFR